MEFTVSKSDPRNSRLRVGRGMRLMELMFRNLTRAILVAFETRNAALWNFLFRNLTSAILAACGRG